MKFACLLLAIASMLHASSGTRTWNKNPFHHILHSHGSIGVRLLGKTTAWNRKSVRRNPSETTRDSQDKGFVKPAKVPPTKAPPTGSSPSPKPTPRAPDCSKEYAKWMRCIKAEQDDGRCFDCDTGTPGNYFPGALHPREQCDAFNGWFLENVDCCAKCEGKLEQFKYCKDCEITTPSPSPELFTPSPVPKTSPPMSIPPPQCQPDFTDWTSCVAKELDNGGCFSCDIVIPGFPEDSLTPRVDCEAFTEWYIKNMNCCASCNGELDQFKGCKECEVPSLMPSPSPSKSPSESPTELPECQKDFTGWTTCVNDEQGDGNCLRCNVELPSSPDNAFVPNEDCDAFAEWYLGNIDCCENCDDALDQLEACKGCDVTIPTPPPTPEPDSPAPSPTPSFTPSESPTEAPECQKDFTGWTACVDVEQGDGKCLSCDVSLPGSQDDALTPGRECDDFAEWYLGNIDCCESCDGALEQLEACKDCDVTIPTPPPTPEPDTPAPSSMPSPSPSESPSESPTESPPECQEDFSEWTVCVSVERNGGRCFGCDDSLPGSPEAALSPGQDCDAFADWYLGNMDCCDRCIDELDQVEDCKSCKVIIPTPAPIPLTSPPSISTPKPSPRPTKRPTRRPTRRPTPRAGKGSSESTSTSGKGSDSTSSSRRRSSNGSSSTRKGNDGSSNSSSRKKKKSSSDSSSTKKKRSSRSSDKKKRSSSKSSRSKKKKKNRSYSSSSNRSSKSKKKKRKGWNKKKRNSGSSSRRLWKDTLFRTLHYAHYDTGIRSLRKRMAWTRKRIRRNPSKTSNVSSKASKSNKADTRFGSKGRNRKKGSKVRYRPFSMRSSSKGSKGSKSRSSRDSKGKGFVRPPTPRPRTPRPTPRPTPVKIPPTRRPISQPECKEEYMQWMRCIKNEQDDGQCFVCITSLPGDTFRRALTPGKDCNEFEDWYIRNVNCCASCQDELEEFKDCKDCQVHIPTPSPVPITPAPIPLTSPPVVVTPAPVPMTPSPVPVPACQEDYTGWTSCVENEREGDGDCFGCNLVPPSPFDMFSTPGEDCDEFNDWYLGNVNCCDPCDDELDDLRDCKECEIDSPPPTPEIDTPPPTPEPDTPAPVIVTPAPVPLTPSPVPVPECQEDYTDWTSCVENERQNSGNCIECNLVLPGSPDNALSSGEDCEEFNDWYLGNINCCDACDDELDDLRDCKDCEIESPPPTPENDTPPPTSEPDTPAPATITPAPVPMTPSPVPLPECQEDYTDWTSCVENERQSSGNCIECNLVLPGSPDNALTPGEDCDEFNDWYLENVNCCDECDDELEDLRDCKECEIESPPPTPEIDTPPPTFEPDTPAPVIVTSPPVPIPEPECQEDYNDWTNCVDNERQGSGNCFECNLVLPGVPIDALTPGEECDEFNNWYLENVNCCDPCNDELDELRDCKECEIDSPPPTPEIDTPPPTMEPNTPAPVTVTPSPTLRPSTRRPTPRPTPRPGKGSSDSSSTGKGSRDSSSMSGKGSSNGSSPSRRGKGSASNESSSSRRGKGSDNMSSSSTTRRKKRSSNSSSRKKNRSAGSSPSRKKKKRSSSSNNDKKKRSSSGSNNDKKNRKSSSSDSNKKKKSSDSSKKKKKNDSSESSK